jgi:hypothetical protein
MKFMAGKDGYRSQVAFLAVSLAISVLSSLVTGRYGFTAAEQTLLTVCLFTVFALLDVILVIGRNADHRIKAYELWSVRNEADIELANIRHSFAELARLSHGRKDIFISHFMKEIHNLAKKIKEASDKQELRTASEFYVKAEDIFESFVGEADLVLRYVWPIDPKERLFGEPAWGRFFEVKVRMVEKKKIRGACAILIFERADDIKNPKVQKLLEFFRTNDGHSCRIMMRDDFAKLCAENGIPGNYLDFGIYGSRMLFRSERYNPEYIGVYTKDEGLVQTYAKFFDTLWDSPTMTTANPVNTDVKVDVEHLMAFDLGAVGAPGEKK